MTNLQTFAAARVLRFPTTVQAYRLQITPRATGIELAGTIRTRRPAAEVRELVRTMALRRWPDGFTFRVRAV